MSQNLALPARLVRCPGCGKRLAYDLANPARPFCSARCRSSDLAAWASENFRVDAASAADAADDAADDAVAPDSAH